MKKNIYMEDISSFNDNAFLITSYDDPSTSRDNFLQFLQDGKPLIILKQSSVSFVIIPSAPTIDGIIITLKCSSFFRFQWANLRIVEQ